MINAKLDINGTLNVGSQSGIYTTNGSENYANVYSSKGTGKIAFNSELKDSVTDKQYNWDNGVETNTLYPLYLRNSVNEIENPSDTFCYLFNEKPLSGNVISFDSTINKRTKKINTTNSYNVNFLDQNNVSLKISKTFTTGEQFIFPTTDDVSFDSFRYKGFKVKKRKTQSQIYDAGKSYQLDFTNDFDAYALYGGWINLNGEKYYIDYETGDYYKGLKKVDYDNEIRICKFKEDGAFDLGYTGTYLNPIDNKYYFIESGVAKEKGFYKYATSLASTDYNYVFVSDDNTLLKGGTYYINIDDKISSILPSGTYNFDENGLIIKEDKDTSSYNEDNVYIKNIDNKGDSAFIDGIRVGIGLFKDGNYLKYADSTGFIVKNTTYYVSKTNNINGIKEGLYYFDNEGRMYDENFILIEVK